MKNDLIWSSKNEKTIRAPCSEVKANLPDSESEGTHLPQVESACARA